MPQGSQSPNLPNRFSASHLAEETLGTSFFSRPPQYKGVLLATELCPTASPFLRVLKTALAGVGSLSPFVCPGRNEGRTTVMAIAAVPSLLTSPAQRQAQVPLLGPADPAGPRTPLLSERGPRTSRNKPHLA